uniref:Uncharacterized protein n=1 Tax=Arundo donax TaxID=35708 RepID=A0A0A9AU60_ARUDO
MSSLTGTTTTMTMASTSKATRGSTMAPPPPTTAMIAAAARHIGKVVNVICCGGLCATAVCMCGRVRLLVAVAAWLLRAQGQRGDRRRRHCRIVVVFHGCGLRVAAPVGRVRGWRLASRQGYCAFAGL